MWVKAQSKTKAGRLVCRKRTGAIHMKPQAKTINLLLCDGSLQGVISIEDSSWNSGELYAAPRDSVEDLLATDACGKYGVYLLLSNDKVYVGQSSDLARRLTQHVSGKDWWESAVILTTKDDSLNHADIDYLESVLIEKARGTGRLDCDNANKGNPRKVDKFRSVFLDQYLEEALFLMQLIGITVFLEGNRGSGRPSSRDGFVIDTMDTKNRLRFGTRTKSDAIQYAKEHGVILSKNVSYASLQSSSEDYWLNPRVDCLEDEWFLLLNDNRAGQLIVLRVPARALQLKADDGGGLSRRADKPELIDLHIAAGTLVDRASGIDFSQFVLQRISY